MDNVFVPEIFSPSSYSELVKIMARRPAAVFYAGGLYLAKRNEGSLLKLFPTVVALDKVSELKRIGRTERFMEIGACVTIQAALAAGKLIFPRALYAALSEGGAPSVQSRATIGGSICIKEKRMDCFVALVALETTVEIRGFNKEVRRRLVRRTPLSQFIKESGEPDLAPGELVTRVLIPFEEWDHQYYCKLGRKYSYEDTELTFCALLRETNGEITAFRWVVGDGDKRTIRDMAFEAEIIGRHFPLQDRDDGIIIAAVDNAMKKIAHEYDEFFLYRVKTLTMAFLKDAYLKHT